MLDRSAFMAQLRLAARRHAGLEGAVVVFDLGRLAPLDVAHEWLIADEVLSQVAGRVADLGTIGGARIAAIGRIGSDEFALHLPTITERATLLTATEELRKRIEHPVPTTAGEIAPRIAIGARVCGGSTGAEQSVIDARAALAEARANRRPIVLSCHDTRARRTQQLELRRELPTAIAAGSIRLAYRPVVDAFSGRPRSIDSVQQWWHPRLGPVGPTLLLPIAETAGRDDDLRRSALASIGQQIASWQDQSWFDDGFRVGLDIPAHRLAERSVIEEIRDALAIAGADLRGLLVWILGPAPTDDLDAMSVSAETIAEWGAAVGVDLGDARCVHLDQLARLAVDRVRIGRGLMDRIGHDPAAVTSLTATAAICREFDLDVVIHGVDRPNHLDVARLVGCHLASGRHFGEAAPSPEVEDTLRHLADISRRTADPANWAAPHFVDERSVSPIW